MQIDSRQFRSRRGNNASRLVMKRGRSGDIGWKVFTSRQGHAVPPSRLPDLLDTGSLTRRLLEKAEGDFRVEPLVQRWMRPDFSERRRLGLKDRDYAFVRAVSLRCKGETWVLARSVIPSSTLKGKNRFLLSLGNKPLGAALFKDPSLERTLFEIAPMAARTLPALGLGQVSTKQAAWARRSVFCLHGKPLLVTEVFLPVCPPLH